MTKGLIVSKNKLRILNGLKRAKQISSEFRFYISDYQLIYKHLVKEAKKGILKNLFCVLKIKLKEYGK